MKKLVVAITVGAVVGATVAAVKKVLEINKKAEAEAEAIVAKIDFDEMFKELDKELEEIKDRNSAKLVELGEFREKILRVYAAETEEERIRIVEEINNLIH